MKIYRGLHELPLDLGKTVVTIGNFDGVHCGHRWVIARVRERAATLGAKSVAITLDPHPARVLRPEQAPKLITPLPRKLELLAEAGLDATLVLPFSQEMSHTSAEDFARGVLHEALHAAEVHEGEDFRFGYRAESDVEGLSSLGQKLGFAVHAYHPLEVRGEAVSSSRIRKVLGAGDVSTARALLGTTFAIDSTPASGRGYGTKYAVPTINLAPYSELLPANGVYVTRLRIGREWFDGVTNIGNRPTFGADSFAVESHLFGFHSLDLSETTPLRMEFLKRLRDEMKFPNVDALRAQISADVARAQRWFRIDRAVMKTSHSAAVQVLPQEK
ncbi:MAG: bifunctional riboflavin kinase/FAD synthetase [Acidobacteria bacterium]|nr:bifunctional riboflavin kinase/FAD synthetase [Acidobacteriota bacterium]